MVPLWKSFHNVAIFGHRRKRERKKKKQTKKRKKWTDSIKKKNDSVCGKTVERWQL